MPHRTEVDRHGRFVAAAIDDDAIDAWLSRDERDALAGAADAAGAALAAIGYRGPFTVDAFRYRDAWGRSSFHPLCEVNARISFGLVARAHAERAGRASYVLRP